MLIFSVILVGVALFMESRYFNKVKFLEDKLFEIELELVKENPNLDKLRSIVKYDDTL